MKNTFFRLVLAAFAGLTGPTSEAWGQAYGFGQSQKPVRKKLPQPVPGRVHLRDGSTRTVPLVYGDYNQIIAIENGVESTYTPLEVSSFVMEQDSFVVLKDFKVAQGKDEQEFRIAFVQVAVAGPRFVLYRFRGSMRHEVEAHSAPGGTVGGIGTPGGHFVGGGEIPESTQFVTSKVWFLKLDGDPRWLSLARSGQPLTSLVKPVIADDQPLTKAVRWNFLSDDEARDILVKYLANKRTGPD